MTTLTKALLAVIAVLVLVAGVLWWQVEHHKHDAIDAAVAPAKEQAKMAAVKVESVTVVVAGKRDTLLRVLRDTVTVPEHVLHPVTPADTASAVAALSIVKAERDSVARSCSEFLVSCDEFRAAAQAKFRADSVVIAALDAQVRARPLPRHWRLGITGGYGALLSHSQIITGPSLVAGLTWSPF